MAAAIASCPSRSRLPGVVGALVLAAVLGGIGLHDAGAQSAGATSVMVPVDPFRILDTRQGIGTGGVIAPVGAGSTITLQVAGVGTVPADATGIVLNVTATQGTQAGYVTMWPTGTTRPEASVLNISPGLDLPNMITASLGAGGRIDIYNFEGSVHLIADVAAYLVPGGGGAQGPQGPQGLQGPAGPAGPTAASFARHIGDVLIPETPVEVARLSDANSGPGTLTTNFSARLVINGALSGYNTGITGQYSVINCRLQLDAGSGFADIGHPMRVDAPGNTSHFVYFSGALAAGADVPAGTYDIRIVCTDIQNTDGTSLRVDRASINVVAVAR